MTYTDGIMLHHSSKGDVFVGEMQVFNISGVNCFEKDGIVYLNTENCARGLGFTTIAASGNETVRWNTVYQYLKKLGVVAGSCNGNFKAMCPEYIPENVFYRLAMKAKNATAEAFQATIADEVIPSIRKHGLYATPQTIEKILNDPDVMIGLLEELKKERQEKALIAAKNSELESKIEEDKPMTDLGLEIVNSEGCITIAQLSAMLCQKGVDTGEKRLFQEMRVDGFLNSTGSYYNKPAQRFLDNGNMEYRMYNNKYTNKLTFQPLITAKGVQYFMDYYLRKHGRMEILTVHRRQIVERKPNYKQVDINTLEA